MARYFERIVWYWLPEREAIFMMQTTVQNVESDSQKLGTALFLLESMLREIGTANSSKELKDSEPVRRARAFVQRELGR